MPSIILMSDPEVARVPVRDCGEPLVDLRELPFVVVDPRQADAAGAFAHLREGVAWRLARAARLLPDGLRLANPDWPEEYLREQTSRSLSPPEIGPHVAGAAVDLTLCTVTGEELDMGTAVDASPEESDDACYTDAPHISEAARGNRRILSAALTTAGLVNYPTEWWHWSYGDRYWALMTGAPGALYGPAEFGGP
jgi:zinc D-Ala-D-Ala dipeptidase